MRQQAPKIEPLDDQEFDRRWAALKLPPTIEEATAAQVAAAKELVAGHNAYYAALAAQAEPGDGQRFLAYLAAGGDFDAKDWKRDPRTPPAPKQAEG